MLLTSPPFPPSPLPLPCLTFYVREDIVFKDPFNTFEGINTYRLIFSALRFYGRLFFRHLSLEVQRIWQPESHVIIIRWCVHGVPRLPWESHGRFDGTSEYRLDRKGKIFSHKVDNIAWSDPPRYQPLTVMELLRLSGARTTATPTITCSFKSVAADIQADSQGLVLHARKFSWWRLYLALLATVSVKHQQS